MEATAQLVDFFERFKLLKFKLNESNINSKKDQIGKLLEGFKSINTSIRAHERLTAQSYNIFWVLKNVEADETRIHSPFLADLLSFNGDHKQGGLFYTEFLNLLKLEDKAIFTPTIPSLQKVEIEKWTGNGKIDVMISYFDKEKRFAIGIENKIYAPDQPLQLERYYYYLNSLYENFILVYLTPTGHFPSIPESIDRELFDALILNKKLILVSYHEGISSLLERTAGFIKAQNVKYIINQYSDLINSL